VGSFIVWISELPHCITFMKEVEVTELGKKLLGLEWKPCDNGEINDYLQLAPSYLRKSDSNT